MKDLFTMKALVLGQRCLQKRKAHQRCADIRDGSSSQGLPTYMFVMAVLSYYGVFGPRKLIAFPWDTVIAIVVTLAFHYWAVFSAFRTKAIDQILGKA